MLVGNIDNIGNTGNIGNIKFVFMGKIIAVTNHKGGVGKTTSVSNLAFGFADRGKRVLMVDTDPQSHLTLSAGVKQVPKSLYEVLCKGESVKKVLVKVNERLDLLPAATNLANAEIELVSAMSREQQLKKALKGIRKDYDYVFIDCPPSLGLLPVNALTAADEVYIPLQSQFLAMNGMSSLVKIIKEIKHNVNDDLKIGCVFLTHHDKRKILNKNVQEVAIDHFKDRVCESTIRMNVALAEAPSQGKSIYEYAPASNGAKDYGALCDEILEKYS